MSEACRQVARAEALGGGGRHARAALAGGVVVLTAACSGGTPVVADGACQASARYPAAIGCAYVYGTVRDADGAPMDSVEGLVRLGDACVCSTPRLESDEKGVYSTVVHRLPGGTAFVDTATATVVALASAPKYPRHVTGAAYFDTSRVVLRFVPLGDVPPPREVNLRITIPGQ